MPTEAPTKHQIVTQDEWIAAGSELLKKEKEFTHARDAMSAAREASPTTPNKLNLADGWSPA